MIKELLKLIFIAAALIFLTILGSCGEISEVSVVSESEGYPAKIHEKLPETTEKELSLVESMRNTEIIDITEFLNAENDSGDPYELSVLRMIDSRDSLTGSVFKLICGVCEPGSEITITGDNITEVTEYSGRSRFFIPIYYKENIECEITITAKNKKNTEEENLTVKCTPIINFEMASFTIGKNNFVHWPDAVDYMCDNYLNDESLANISNVLNTRYDRIKKAVGIDTKFFILLAPDPLVIYDETASDSLQEKRLRAMTIANKRYDRDIDPEAEIYTAMNQIADYVNSKNPEFTLVDMTSILRSYKDDEPYPRLYHTTDNHWSSLGAYLGYREIMDFVYETSGIEATKPLELSNFDMVDYNLSFSSQIGLGDPWSFDIYEVVDMLIPKIPRTAVLTSGEILNDGKFWSDVRYPMSFTTDNSDLPTAVILRDSFATALYPMLNEHFYNIYYSDTWDYSIDYDWLQEINPDYVIIIAVERLSMSALNQR